MNITARFAWSRSNRFPRICLLSARIGDSGMPATAKPKVKDAGARQRLIEATVQIMRDEGYVAATSRRVAATARGKPALVYYYFDTMDDLFVAVLRAGAEAALSAMRRAI